MSSRELLGHSALFVVIVVFFIGPLTGVLRRPVRNMVRRVARVRHVAREECHHSSPSKVGFGTIVSERATPYGTNSSFSGGEPGKRT